MRQNFFNTPLHGRWVAAGVYAVPKSGSGMSLAQLLNQDRSCSSGILAGAVIHPRWISGGGIFLCAKEKSMRRNSFNIPLHGRRIVAGVYAVPKSSRGGSPVDPQALGLNGHGVGREHIGGTWHPIDTAGEQAHPLPADVFQEARQMGSISRRLAPHTAHFAVGTKAPTAPDPSHGDLDEHPAISTEPLSKKDPPLIRTPGWMDAGLWRRDLPCNPPDLIE
jgi:hypothetical protein